ncbi:DNA polymerase [Bienertia sinuspersici]
MKVSPGGIMSFTIGKAIPLTFDDGKLIPQSHVYARILRAVTTISERYDTCMVKGVTLRVFVEGRVENRSSLSLEERMSNIEIIVILPTLKNSTKAVKPFLVADTETILYKGEDLDPSSSLEASPVEVHSPFTASVMIVRPRVPVKDSIIDYYYSTDYTPIIYPTHKERSTRVLDDILKRIISIIRPNPEIQTVYFHNFSRFDGIFLLKHLIVHNEKYEVKPLMRNHRLDQVDIEKWMTVASLALGIYQTKYFDESLFYIHIPNRNEDTFIHRGYYGGHTDAYIPRGKPVRHSNLSGMDLDSMCGFIEAYVECPNSMGRPFLPYRGKDNILLFPTGQWVGVYYSEELKYAREQGYTVLPIRGYLFQKMEGPFQAYFNTLYESRSEANKQGNESMSFVYKLLMN